MHVKVLKRGYSKLAVPRHRTLSRQGAAALERAIERQERQAGKKAIAQWLAEEKGEGSDHAVAPGL